MLRIKSWKKILWSTRSRPSLQTLAPFSRMLYMGKITTNSHKWWSHQTGLEIWQVSNHQFRWAQRSSKVIISMKSKTCHNMEMSTRQPTELLSKAQRLRLEKQPHSWWISPKFKQLIFQPKGNLGIWWRKLITQMLKTQSKKDNFRSSVY
jgi:hypothetical protein